MLDLALHSSDGPVSVAEIAKRQELSPSYLEQLFSKLRRAELVKSSRGPGGGFSIGRDIAQVSVADIIDAVDERVDATSCSGKSDCNEGHTCLTHHLWNDLSERIHEFLTSVSLATLVERREVQNVHFRQHAADDEQTLRIVD